MTKTEMKEIMKNAVDPHKLCRVYLKYDHYYRYYFPLIVGERLFLGAEEDDFILDGYSIRRFTNVTLVEIKDDKCVEIFSEEGLIDSLVTPNIDITNWATSLQSLQTLGKNIIIEQESPFEEEANFVIGRVIKVLKTKVVFRHFDGDGIWEEEFYEIPFSKITSITFGSRYVEVFSKYLPPIS